MPALTTSLALLLAATAALGPDEEDPVVIVDDPGAVEVELEYTPRSRQVSIERARWESLRAMAEAAKPKPTPPPGPWATHREVVIERSSEGLRVRGTWSLASVEPGWWTGRLLGPLAGMRVESATWRGKAIGVTETSAGLEASVELGAKTRGELELVAFIPAESLPGGVDGALALDMAPAVRGEVLVKGAGGLASAPDGRVPELVADGNARRTLDGLFWAGEQGLRLDWVDAPAQDDAVAEGPLAVAQAAMGLTFGDGEVRGHARVSWLLRRGALDQVSLRVEGLGNDLALAGPNVLEWTRSGDRIDVKLREPADARVDVELRWTRGLPNEAEASLSAPRILPDQAYRTERTIQVARDGEFEVLPELEGWTAVASTELPDWAGGYIQGSATASYRREGKGAGEARFDLLRFVPISGPPVVVDVAAYEIATTDEGRSLVQARYDVRNERASHLRVALPPNSRLLGVRVGGEAVTPAADGSPDKEAGQPSAWRIPLERSLESVKGTLSFPVELIFIADSDADWERKESRELRLPALDAPVAVNRVRVYLPPRYENRVDVGEHHRVDGFSEGAGITYGLGVGAGSEEVARADELYREALEGWMDNDFRQAQSSLDELSALGASNANIDGLQANLDLVSGAYTEDAKQGGQSAVVARRIRDQANTRAADDRIELLEKAAEADKLEAEGRYEEAEKTLEEAQVLGEQLALLEQVESQEQVAYNRSLSSIQTRVTAKKKRKREAKKKQRLAEVEVTAKATKAKEGKADEGKDAAPMGGKAKAPKRVNGEIVYVVDEEPAPPVEEEPDPDMIALGGEGEGITVYDFESDDVSGEVLTPAGGALSTGGPALPKPEPAPEPAPEPRVQAELERRVETPPASSTELDAQYGFDDDLDGELLTPEGANISARSRSKSSSLIGDGMRGPDASRDFTAVVDVTPTASRDDAGEPVTITMEEAKAQATNNAAAGISLAGTTAAEEMEMPMADAAPAPPRQRDARRARRSRKRRSQERRPPADRRANFMSADDFSGNVPTDAPVDEAPPPPPPPADPNAALAGPVAEASAVAVHIPAIGETVLYQHMLLREGEALTVHLEAKRSRKPR